MANAEDERIIAMCDSIEKKIKTLVEQNGEKLFDGFSFSMEAPFVCQEGEAR